MRIEFAPSSAVPVNVIAHGVELPGSVAVPFAPHATVVPVSVPDAVPATLRPPAHVALNEPLAVVAVCSVGCHWKSTHVDGDGIAPPDVEAHVPISASAVEVGPVTDDSCSKPTQPAAAIATATTIAKA